MSGARPGAADCTSVQVVSDSDGERGRRRYRAPCSIAPEPALSSRRDGSTSLARRAGPPHPHLPMPALRSRGRFAVRGFRVENLRHVGWQLFMPATYVTWCGHGQEVIPVPLPDGRVTFVPVLGEAN